MDKTQIRDLINNALEAAAVATREYEEKHPNQWYPCGFAWVVVKPGNSPVANALKASGKGSKHYAGGVSVWNPGGSPTQWMDSKYAGAVAFAKVLNDAGIIAYADSRMD